MMVAAHAAVLSRFMYQEAAAAVVVVAAARGTSVVLVQAAQDPMPVLELQTLLGYSRHFHLLLATATALEEMAAAEEVLLLWLEQPAATPAALKNQAVSVLGDVVQRDRLRLDEGQQRRSGCPDQSAAAVLVAAVAARLRDRRCVRLQLVVDQVLAATLHVRQDTATAVLLPARQTLAAVPECTGRLHCRLHHRLHRLGSTASKEAEGSASRTTRSQARAR